MNNLRVLYEDNHIIVVIKPFNIPSQEDSSKDIDMITIIKNYLKEKYKKKGNVYLGLVHRLDRPASGIMVFAKTSKAASRLSEEVRNRTIKKTYLAICHGKTKEKEKLINYISKDNKTNNSYIDDKNGKESILTYTRINYDEKEDLSLIKVDLETGRHHQIRLQMKTKGYPLYGDQRYGNKDKKQLALYAYKLEFIHPVTKEKMLFTKLPDEIGVWKLINEVREVL